LVTVILVIFSLWSLWGGIEILRGPWCFAGSLAQVDVVSISPGGLLGAAPGDGGGLVVG
jgi:LytS/YehU family sensor histidine kinase